MSASVTPTACLGCTDGEPAEPGFRFCSKSCASRFRAACYMCRQDHGASRGAGRSVSRRFCSEACFATFRRRELVPKVLRPVCPRFMSARGCPWREACYDRHCVSRPDAAPYDLALGVTKVHVERFITYLHNELRFQIDAATESDQESPVGARRKRAVEESHESDNAWYRLRVVHTENKAVEGLRLPGDEALQTADEAAMAASIVSMKHFSEKMAKTTTSSPAASTTDADSKRPR